MAREAADGACVFMVCVWRRYTSLPEAHVKHLVRQASSQAGVLEMLFLICRVKILSQGCKE